MIQLTRLNRSALVLNADLIEQIQPTPDTVVTLTSGRNFLVLETPDEVIRRVVEYRRRIAGGRLHVMNGPAVENTAAFADSHEGDF